jgi:MFS superfamily sulfate permease-like transporter
VVILDVDIGLLIGVSASIFTIVIRDQCGPVKPVTNYQSLSPVSLDNESAESRFRVFRIKSSIYFATVEKIKRDLFKHYEKFNSSSLILDFSAVNYVDTNGVKALQQIVEHFEALQVSVCICAPQGNF